jgi:hypothetical protein
MKAAWTAVLFCTLACGVSAAPLQFAPGSWEFTTLLRNFSISADGKHEIETGGSRPYTERACITKPTFDSSTLWPGLKFPAVAKRCKATTISETPSLIDSVSECSGDGAAPPKVTHILVIPLAPKSFTTIQEVTFLEPLADGSLARSTIYRRGRWLKEDCGKSN